MSTCPKREKKKSQQIQSMVLNKTSSYIKLNVDRDRHTHTHMHTYESLLNQEKKKKIFWGFT